MTWTDLKFYMVNTLGFVVTLSNIEQVLQLLIAMVALGYGLHKWYIMYKNNGQDS